MADILKPIEGYEGLYVIDMNGNIYSSYRNKKKLKCRITKNGYKQVKLYKNKKQATYYLHRLVAQAFIPNPDNKPQINHKNGIKTDNTIENLERLTSSENHSHSYEHLGRISRGGLHGRYGKDNPNSKAVAQYSKMGDLLRKWYSISDIEKELGIHNSNIGRCCSGKRATAGGYKRKYI